MSFLSEYAVFSNGKKRPIKDGQYPVYGGNGVLGFADDFNMENGVIIGRVGAYCGSVFLERGKCWVSDNAIKAINTPKSNLTYLYYLLKGLRLNERRIGTSQPLLTQAILNNIEVDIPDIKNQKKIADMLGAIDKKLEVNTIINENLEVQAQAIYASFISDHQTTTVTVEEVVLTANTGADAIQKAPIVDHDTGVRCVRVGDMSNQRPAHEWGFAQVTPEIFKQYQLHKYDIVVTRTASLGLNRLIGEDLNAVYNNGLIRISINQDVVYPLIVYRQFQTDDYINYISRISGETSVRPNMKINYLLKYSFDIPCLSDQSELISILQPIFETQERNIYENQTLTSLRDTLLPKLMSGELDVSELDL